MAPVDPRILGLSPLDADPGPSSLFLLPAELPDAPIGERRSEPHRSQFAVQAAAAIAAVSVLAGLLYTLYYLRVGNPVTALLPRDTVLYARAGSVADLHEALFNLDIWQSSRPIRERVRRHESDLLSGVLLDIGIGSTGFDALRESARALHLAVLAAAPGSAHGRPYELLAFIEVPDPDARERLLNRIRPYFTRRKPQGDTAVYARWRGQSTLAMGSFDELVVLCWGEEDTLRRVLENRGRGPSGSLNDEPGFRVAYRDGARDADVWMWTRRDHLVRALVERVVAPHLGGNAKRLAVAAHARVLTSGIASMAASTSVRGGFDFGHLGLYPAEDAAFEAVSLALGTRERRALDAIPANAEVAIALSLNDPAAVLTLIWQPVAAALAEVGDWDPNQELNRFQAESGVNLLRQVWPLLGREVAWAQVPVDEDATWMVVVQVKSVDRATLVMDRIVEHLARTRFFEAGRITHTIAGAGSNHRVTRTVEHLEPDGSFTPDDSTEALCWGFSGSRVIVSSRCDVVVRAQRADDMGTGLDRDERISLALDGLPSRTTAIVIHWLRPYLRRALGPRPVFDLISDEFVAVTAVTVEEEGVVLDSNVSPLALGFIGLTGLLDMNAPGTHEEDPCGRLVARVCREVSDPMLCAQWKALVPRNPASACRTGLRIYEGLATTASGVEEPSP